MLQMFESNSELGTLSPCIDSETGPSKKDQFIGVFTGLSKTGATINASLKIHPPTDEKPVVGKTQMRALQIQTVSFLGKARPH